MSIDIKALDFLSQDLLDEVIEKHLDCFESGLSTKLGKRYLSYFYNRVASSSDSIFLACFDENKELWGFICGTIDCNKFYNLKHNMTILSYLFLSLVTFKFSLTIFLRAIIKKIKFFKHKIQPELLSLFIYPEKRKRGLGKELVLALSDFFRRQNVNIWKVSTEGKLSDTFYSKLGMDKVITFCFIGVQSSLFTASISGGK